jgi:hypothetical protein
MVVLVVEVVMAVSQVVQAWPDKEMMEGGVITTVVVEVVLGSLGKKELLTVMQTGVTASSLPLLVRQLTMLVVVQVVIATMLTH